MLPSHRHRGRKHPLHSRRFRAAKRAQRGFVSLGTLETSRREIEGDDWIDVWKKHFRPLHIGKRVVVCPEWIPYEPKEGEVIVTLDSNMAFGTGEHETTSMCLELLQEYLKEGDTVVDVGCGSGILGIAALKLGAKFAYMTDIDYVAVKSATHNCERNGWRIAPRWRFPTFWKTRTCAAK